MGIDIGNSISLRNNMLFKKKLKVPENNNNKEIDVYQLWSVKWYRRINDYSYGFEPVAEFFTSEEEAKNFYNSLINALKLLRNTSYQDNRVSIQKEK